MNEPRVWIVEFQQYGRKWVPSSDYDLAYRTKKEATEFLKSEGQKGLNYRAAKYQRVVE